MIIMVVGIASRVCSKETSKEFVREVDDEKWASERQKNNSPKSQMKLKFKEKVMITTQYFN